MAEGKEEVSTFITGGTLEGVFEMMKTAWKPIKITESKYAIKLGCVCGRGSKLFHFRLFSAKRQAPGIFPSSASANS